MRKSFLPLIVIVALIPTAGFAQGVFQQPVAGSHLSFPQPTSIQQPTSIPQPTSIQQAIPSQTPILQNGDFLSGNFSNGTITPNNSTTFATQPWIGSPHPMTSANQINPTHQATPRSRSQWSNSRSGGRRQTLPPMVTRAPIIASPVLAAPMIMSVKSPERYNYASPTGYSPARGGFIFGRRGRR